MDHASHSSSGLSLADEIRAATGQNPARCYQCAKCSAGCPMAAEQRLRPHEIMRLIQLGQREQLLADPSIWLCLTCETCSARCPNACDPARVIDALREIALRDSKVRPPRSIAAFHRTFLEQIYKHGRVFEFGLMLGYKLRTGELFADVMTVPGLMTRGKLALAPRHISGMREVRRIFKACSARKEEA